MAAEITLPKNIVYTCDIWTPGFFGGNVGCIQIELKSASTSGKWDEKPYVKTLRSLHVQSRTGAKLLSIEPKKKIEIRGFHMEEIMGRNICVAATVNANAQGFISLHEGVNQILELSKETVQNAVLRVYENKKNVRSKRPNITLSLSDLIVKKSTAKDDAIEIRSRSDFNFKPKDIVFNSQEEYQSAWYIFSQNRTLESFERIARIVGQSNQDMKEIDNLFEKIVVRRSPKAQRENLRKLNLDLKLGRIDAYMAFVEEKTMEELFKDLTKPTPSAREMCFVRGALLDEDNEYLREFIFQGGITKITQATVRAKDNSPDVLWQMFYSALECIEAIMEKEPPKKDTYKSGIEYILDDHNCLNFIIEQFDHNDIRVRKKMMVLLESLVLFAIDKDLSDSIKNIVRFLTDFAKSKKKSNLWYLFEREIHRELEKTEMDESVRDEDQFDILYCSDVIDFCDQLLKSDESLDTQARFLSEIQHSKLEEELESLMDFIDGEEARANESYRQQIQECRDFEHTFKISRDEIERQLTYDNFNMTNIRDMFDFLYKQSKEGGREENLANVIKCLMCIPCDVPSIWDIVVKMLSLITQRINDQMYEINNDEHDYYHSYQHVMDILKREQLDLTLLAAHQNVVPEAPSPAVVAPSPEVQNISAASPEPAGALTLAPELEKYAKMLKMKIPEHAVENKMTQDGVNPGRLQEIKDFLAGVRPSVPSGPAPVLDEKLQKYVKMIKMKIPDHAVQNKMRQDGIDPDRLQEIKDFIAGVGTAPPASAAAPVSGPAPVLADDLKKYHKMFKMKIPEHAIANKMRQDGIDESRMQEIKDFMNGVPSGPPKTAPAAKPFCPPELEKYAKMLGKMKMPEHVVQNKMRMDGLEARFPEVDAFCKGLPPPNSGGSGGPPKAPEIPEKLKKYKKMMKMLPENAIRNRMIQDGIEDPDHAMKVIKGEVAGVAKPKPKKKPKPEEKMTAFWGQVYGTGTQGIDDSAFTALFAAEPEETKKVAKPKAAPKPPVEEKINLVMDPKVAKALTFVIPKIERRGLDNKALKQALWALDSEKITLDLLGSLEGVVPGEGTWNAGWKGDASKLDKASQFYYALRKVPIWGNRVKWWIFKETFEDQFNNANIPMETILTAVKACKASNSLKQFLFLLVRIFNSSKDKKKFHKGFELRYLDAATRRKVGGKSYLQVAAEFARKSEGMLDWLEELKVIKPALKYKDVKELKSIVQNAGRAFNMVKNGVVGYKKKTHEVERGCTDNFLAVFEPFIGENLKKNKALNETLMQLENGVKEMAEQFKEPAIKDNKINVTWLGHLSVFRDKTEKIIEQIAAREEKQKRQEAKQREKEERAKKRAMRQQQEAENSSEQETRPPPARSRGGLPKKPKRPERNDNEASQKTGLPFLGHRQRQTETKIEIESKINQLQDEDSSTYDGQHKGSLTLKVGKGDQMIDLEIKGVENGGGPPPPPVSHLQKLKAERRKKIRAMSTVNRANKGLPPPPRKFKEDPPEKNGGADIPHHQQNQTTPPRQQAPPKSNNNSSTDASNIFGTTLKKKKNTRRGGSRGLPTRGRGGLPKKNLSEEMKLVVALFDELGSDFGPYKETCIKKNVDINKLKKFCRKGKNSCFTELKMTIGMSNREHATMLRDLVNDRYPKQKKAATNVDQRNPPPQPPPHPSSNVFDASSRPLPSVPGSQQRRGLPTPPKRRGNVDDAVNRSTGMTRRQSL